MSLKIYNGYKFKKCMSLLELNERMNLLKEKFKKEMIEEYKRLLMSQIYKYEDLYVLDKEFCIDKMKKDGFYHRINNEEKAITTLAFNTHMNLRDVIEKAMSSYKRDPIRDFSAKIQIHPLEDKILFQFFGENMFEHILLEQPDIEEYHYQNQVDKPEDISDEEWFQRYEDWKKAMPTFVPAKTGFSVSLILEIDIPIMMEELFVEKEYDTYKIDLEKRLNTISEIYYPYPEFNGHNFDVFISQEYKDFIHLKIDELRPLFIDREDPLLLIYQNFQKKIQEE